MYGCFEQRLFINNSNCDVDEHRALRWEDDDPQCYLKPSKIFSKKITSGFYMVEIAAGDASLLDSRLYVNYGRGFNDDDSFSLVVSSNKVSKRIIHLTDTVTKMRWDPAERSGWVTNPKIKLVPLTRSRAVSLMQEKLLRNSQKLDLEAKQILASPIEELYDYYDQYFKRKGFKCYDQWMDVTEPTLWAEKVILETVQFSVIVPVYNSKPEWLEDLFNSVVNQTYGNWQLVLVDDASPSEATRAKLAELAKCDKRVTIIWREKNGHIVRASNDGLKQSKGSFVLFLDHDDCLSTHALNELAHAIKRNPSAKLIYSDEDLMSESGQRLRPHFKSGWNPDLLLSHNYVTHIACYPKNFVEELGGFSEGLDGAQDYDLVLRATARLTPREIVHIPKVLYHWRMVEGSTASQSSAKSYATVAGLKALQSYMQSKQMETQVIDGNMTNFYTVTWPLPTVLPKVSVIIPTKDGLEVLKPCIESIVATANYPSLEIVIIDNGSEKAETISYLSSLCPKIEQRENPEPINVIVVKDPGDFNFSRLMNLGASTATGEILLLLNNDVEALAEGWLQAMVRHACREDIGCVGAKLLYPDLSIQHAGVIIGLGGYAAHSHRGLPRNHPGYFGRAQIAQNLSAVTAACLMVKKSVFESVAGFDESFRVAYNDVDFCLRVMQTGLRNIYVPEAELIHHESKTRGEDVCPEKRRRFDGEKQRLLDRWKSIVSDDPYYNPNLTRSREDFSL